MSESSQSQSQSINDPSNIDLPKATLAESLFYQIWSPNNRFLCKGRIMIGEGWKFPLVTFFLINLPAIITMVAFYRFVDHFLSFFIWWLTWACITSSESLWIQWKPWDQCKLSGLCFYRGLDPFRSWFPHALSPSQRPWNHSPQPAFYFAKWARKTGDSFQS